MSDSWQKLCINVGGLVSPKSSIDQLEIDVAQLLARHYNNIGNVFVDRIYFERPHGLRREQCHVPPVEEVLSARIGGSLQDYGMNTAEKERLLLDIRRTLRGILLETMVNPAPVTFPEHDDMPDLLVRVERFKE